MLQKPLLQLQKTKTNHVPRGYGLVFHTIPEPVYNTKGCLGTQLASAARLLSAWQRIRKSSTSGSAPHLEFECRVPENPRERQADAQEAFQRHTLIEEQAAAPQNDHRFDVPHNCTHFGIYQDAKNAD